MERCLVIVSRDRPDLVHTLASIISGPPGEVEIRLDQRRRQLGTWAGARDRRSALSRGTPLPAYGFLVIPRS